MGLSIGCHRKHVSLDVPFCICQQLMFATSAHLDLLDCNTTFRRLLNADADADDNRHNKGM